MDNINNKYGAHKIHLAIQDEKQIWKMNQNSLSPAYTTKITDIIIYFFSS